MAETIKITSDSLSSTLSSFKAEMDKMTTLLGEIQTETTNIKSSWKGSTSDIVIGQIENFQKVFTDIQEQNKKYEDFINSVINKYTSADNNGINSIESNVSSYSINE